jgi:uncharacterized membrane protein YhaH (DUF805 family)
MNWVQLFTSFEGRISRRPFWIAWIILIAIEIVVMLAAEGPHEDRLTALADLILIYPQFAVCAKRGHDRNTPTWVIGLFFALAAAFDLSLLGGWITTADLKSPPAPVLFLVIPLVLLALVLIVDLGFRRGTRGPNRYGPDPLQAQA